MTAFWPVGLPAYLAFLERLSDHYLLVAKIINLIFSSLFILVLYKLFKDSLSQKQLVFFLILFTLFPNNLFSVNVILTEYPFALLLWVAIFISLSKNLNVCKVILVSVILGLISYLRPVGFLLPVIFALYLYYRYSFKASLKKIAIMLAVFFAILAPWIYRNYNVFNTFVPISTNGGYNFLMGNHAGSKGGINFNFSYKDSLSEVKASHDAYLRGIDDIVKHPFESVIRLPQKVFFAYYRGDSSLTWGLKSTKNMIPSIFLSFVFFVNNYIFYLIVFISILCVISKNDLIKDNWLKYFIVSIYIYLLLIVLNFCRCGKVFNTFVSDTFLFCY